MLGSSSISSPPTSEAVLRFLGPDGTAVSAPPEWSTGYVEIVVPDIPWEQLALSRNGNSLEITQRRLGGQVRTVAEWSLAGTGHYELRLNEADREIYRTLWTVYPRKWGSSGPDSNIDHRRVLNLMTYFERRGKSLPITDQREDYSPGDIVSWDLGGGVPHIGIVSNRAVGTPRHLLIVHNIGAGTRAEDVLFNWQITGHYRYF